MCQIINNVGRQRADYKVDKLLFGIYEHKIMVSYQR